VGAIDQGQWPIPSFLAEPKLSGGRGKPYDANGPPSLSCCQSPRSGASYQPVTDITVVTHRIERLKMLETIDQSSVIETNRLHVEEPLKVTCPCGECAVMLSNVILTENKFKDDRSTVVACRRHAPFEGIMQQLEGIEQQLEGIAQQLERIEQQLEGIKQQVTVEGQAPPHLAAVQH
jgi:hypothetical protein